MKVQELQQHIKEQLLRHEIKKIGISMSGGLDSSVLLYVLCDLLSNDTELLNSIEIIPITGIGDARMDVVSSIFEFINSKYPTVKFNEHQIFRYGGLFSKKWLDHHVPFYSSLYKKNIIDVLLHASTRNAPEDELEKFDFKRSSIDAARSLSIDTVIPEIKYKNNERSETNEGYLQWNIFMAYDKKTTADLYSELGLHDSLAKLTWSCTGIEANTASTVETEQPLTPCKKCYWCVEKKWAFGYY